MGLFSKDIKTMNDLFVHTLRDIYYAEKQIVKALPDMIEKAAGLHREAHQRCFIASSVNFPVRHEPVVLAASTAEWRG